MFPGVPPEPGPSRSVGVRLSRLSLLCHWCSRFRGLRRPPLPRGVAAPMLPRGRGSLPGASAPTSPASARPWRPPAPRNPNCARGLAGWPPFTRQQRTPRPAELRPLTRPHHGGAAAAPVTPKTASTSERSRPPPASAAEGSGAGAGGRGRALVRAGQARGARPEQGRRRRGGARPLVARCASPRRGPGGKRRRGGEGRRKRDPI